MALISVRERGGDVSGTSKAIGRSEEFYHALSAAMRGSGDNGVRGIGKTVASELFELFDGDSTRTLDGVAIIGNQKPPLDLPLSAEYYNGAVDEVNQLFGAKYV